MTEEEGCCGGAPEGREVQHDVIGGRNEPLVDDMGKRDDETAGEGDRQQEPDHNGGMVTPPVSPRGVASLDGLAT